MWDPIVSVSDHCSCFTYIEISAQFHYKLTKKKTYLYRPTATCGRSKVGPFHYVARER